MQALLYFLKKFYISKKKKFQPKYKVYKATLESFNPFLKYEYTEKTKRRQIILICLLLAYLIWSIGFNGKIPVPDCVYDVLLESKFFDYQTKLLFRFFFK